MVTKRELSFISSAMRRVWLYYNEARKEIIKRCFVRRGEYRCECCGVINKGKVGKVLQVDHINKVGSIHKQSFDSFINNLFCPIENLWGLCKNCHDYKTQLERKNVPTKEIIKLLKQKESLSDSKNERQEKVKIANAKRTKRRRLSK